MPPWLPIYFVGQNSRLFQLASHLSLTLRLSLVFRETARRIGTDLRVRVGTPIPFAELEHLSNRNDLIMDLRRRTFALAQQADVNGPYQGSSPAHRTRQGMEARKRR